jgi:hypothetical protein
LQGAFQALAVAAEVQQLFGIVGLVADRVQLFVVTVVQRLICAVFTPVINQPIARNLEQPRTKRRPSLWLTGAADQAQPSVLKHLVSQFRFAAQPEQKAIQTLPMTGVQNLERRAVAFAITRQQRFIAAGGGLSGEANS